MKIKIFLHLFLFKLMIFSLLIYIRYSTKITHEWLNNLNRADFEDVFGSTLGQKSRPAPTLVDAIFFDYLSTSAHPSPAIADIRSGEYPISLPQIEHATIWGLA